MRFSRLIILVLAAPLMAMSQPPKVEPISAPHVYTPYQAVYGLSLREVRDSADILGLSGRLVFKLDGDSCNGYVSESRFVMQMARDGAADILTDIRSSNWEAGDGSSFRFFTSTRMNGQTINSIEGTASQKDGVLTVEHKQPEAKTFRFEKQSLFPMQFHHKLMQAVKSDERFFAASLFDGGEEDGAPVDVSAVLSALQSKKADGTLSGAPIAPVDAFWAVNMAYFNAGSAVDSGPDYEVRFELAQDGIERQMVLDYGDFVIDAKLEKLELSEKPLACEASSAPAK